MAKDKEVIKNELVSIPKEVDKLTTVLLIIKLQLN